VTEGAAATFDLLVLLRVNLFWLLFLVPGLAVVVAWRPAALATLSAGNVPLLILRAYVWTTALLAPVVLVSYLAGWSLAPTVVVFVVLVPAALVVLGREAARHGRDRLRSVRVRPGLGDVPWLLFAALLVFDFGLALLVGNYLQYDAGFHLAKITSTLSSGPSPADPLFGGVIESRYHYNIVHVVHALCAQVSGVGALDAWRYSAAFFRLLFWLAGAAFIGYLFPRKAWRHVLAIAFVLSFYHLEFAPTYPNEAQVMVLWIGGALMLVEYVRARRGGRPWVPLLLEAGVALFLLGFSHPTYGLWGTAFLAVFLPAAVVARYVGVGRLLPLAPVLALPLGFPLFSLLQPDHMPASSREYGVADTEFIHLLGGRLVAVEFNGGQVDARLLLLVLGLVAAAVILRDPVKRLYLFASVLFPIAVLNSPFFLPLLLKVVPYWFIRRVKFVDTTSSWLVMLPFVWGFDLLPRRLPDSLGRRSLQALWVVALGLLLLPSLANVGAYWDRRQANLEAYGQLRQVEQLGRAVTPGAVVLAEPGLAFLVPSVMDARVVAIANLDNANPATPDLQGRLDAVKAYFAGAPADTLAGYLTQPTYLLLRTGEQIPAAAAGQARPLGATKDFRLLQLD